MNTVEVNFVAVLAAAVASMIVGFLWYGPMLFAKPWMKLKGYTEKSLKMAQSEMGKLYGFSFVLAILTAFVLAHTTYLSQYFYGLPKLQTALTTAFWMWLGFVMPVQTTATIFGDKKWKLLAIDTGYQFASLMTMAVVIGLM